MRLGGGRSLAAVAWAALAALVLGACGPRSHAPAARASAFDRVPEGTQAVYWLRPRAALASPAGAQCVRALVDEAAQARLEARNHLRAADVDLIVRAERRDGAVTFVQGRFDAAAVVRAFGERLSSVVLRSDAPFVRRRGYIGDDLREAVELGEGLVAFGGAPEGPMAAVLAGAGRGTRGAFDDVDARAVLDAGADGVAGAISLRPPPSVPEGGAGLLLARVRASGVAFVPRSDEALEMRVDLRGELPEGAESNLRAFAEDVASSDLGDVLGMRESLPTLSVGTAETGAVLRLTIPAAALARGLRVVFLADLPELLGR